MIRELIIDILQLITGIFIISAVWFDFVCTTLTASESGPFAKRMARGVWKASVFSNRFIKSHEYLAAVGPVILVLLIASWAILAWLGWTLIFLSDPTSVLSTSTLLPATAWEMAYYTGFTLTTMGTGDYVPSSNGWRWVTVATSLNGLALITLSITYAIPVVQAAAKQRTVARSIAVMGATPDELLTLWQGRKDMPESYYQGVASFFQNITQDILDVGQNHLAYPVLHFYHSPEVNTSFPLKLTTLDEAIRAIPEDAYQHDPALRVAEAGLHNAIGSFLATLNSAFITPADEEPPETVDLPRRQQSGEKPYNSLEEMSKEHRRKLLAALVEDNGWTWRHVSEPDYDSENQDDLDSENQNS